MSSMVGARNRCPFTGMQRQELEQQFIIFKHIISGLPIPPDLISTVKKTSRLLQQQDSSSTLFPPHHQHSHQPIGWGCFQMGFGRKADAEPGRCRRTDGKKWRCSREAHPDSKYCERHMHRGRNRSSTKPVDPSPFPSSLPKTLKSTISDVDNMSRHHPHHRLFLGSCADKTTYSCFEGLRDEAMEGGAFGAEGSISHQPSTRARSSASGYSQLEPKEEEKGKHCFVLGTDFKSVKIDRVEEEEEEEEEKHKPFHHFFGEWPPKSRDYYSWLDIEENHQSSAQCYDGIGSFTTHLSISMPPSTQDLLFGSKSPNFHNEG